MMTRACLFQIILILLISLIATTVHRGQVDDAPEIMLRDDSDGPDPDAGGNEVVQVGTVTVEQAYQYFLQGAQFIDARSEDKFIEGHVEGAWLLAYSAFASSGYPEVLEYLDPSLTTVIYCEGGECESSKLVARQLLLVEFTELKILTTGFPAWSEAGKPVKTGSAE
jgi:rhodanese-related sulfurtransferase